MREAFWDLKKHRGFWLEWFGAPGRKIGCSKPWYTDNANVFLSTVENSISTRRHCFMSVQPYRSQDVAYGIDKVFFEFNSNKNVNLKETFKQVRGLTKRLRERFGVESLVVWSYRSFQVYVFLRNVMELDIGQQSSGELIYGLLQLELLKGTPHSTLNRECLGNLKQLTWVPYSMHDAGVKCIPVNYNGKPMYIKDLDEYRERVITDSLFKQLVGKASEEAATKSQGFSHLL
jgi:hypothetical protein